MKRVFADTRFYIALLNRKDPAHEKARAWICDPELDNIVTTGWVVAETANATAKSHRRGECGAFLLKLYGNERTEIVPLSDELQRPSFELYMERSDKEWSLTDCISFIVMRERGLTDVFTGDHHFTQDGFVPLLAQ